ncbi:MAG TPA: dihydrofolate reductase family protein [Pedobacter sp.]|nr:dihydrofolate reductase family protein [Pedobacter sp.]
MAKTILSISMSLDGFTAGQNISEDTPLGENGELLHKWLFSDSTDTDKQIVSERFENTGAVILGSRTYNTAIRKAWDGKSPFPFPAFVLVNAAPIMEVAGFTFVKEGITNALHKAKTAANSKNVLVMGGANVAQQFLSQNLLDEIHIQIAPVLLGKGTSLFGTLATPPPNLIKFNAIETKGATHLFFKVKK